MNGSSKHTLYGVIFIAACVLLAGIVYAVIRSPAPEPAIENTSVADMHIDAPEPSPALAAATPAESASASPSNAGDTAQPGRCGMKECSWSKTLSINLVQEDQRGRLIALSLLGGSSRNETSRITWNDRPHTVYVFCSTALPAVMMKVDGGWQVDVLDFVDGVPGVLESSASIYANACHAGDRRFPSDAEALGYSHIDDDREEVQIDQPTDIFDRASIKPAPSGM